MKKVISLILVVAMIASLATGLTITVSAFQFQDTNNPSYLTFTSDEPFTIKGGSGDGMAASWNDRLFIGVDTINWTSVPKNGWLNTTATTGTDGKYHIYLCGRNSYLQPA